MANYNHPNYLVVKETHLQSDPAGTHISCPSINTNYIGSTLRTYTKSLVVGCTVVVQSGGSAAGTNSLKVMRSGVDHTQSAIQVLTITGSAGASAAGDIWDISLTTGFTLASIGDYAVLEGVAASNDKLVVLSDVIWRYRILPFALDDR